MQSPTIYTKPSKKFIKADRSYTEDVKRHSTGNLVNPAEHPFFYLSETTIDWNFIKETIRMSYLSTESTEQHCATKVEKYRIWFQITKMSIFPIIHTMCSGWLDDRRSWRTDNNLLSNPSEIRLCASCLMALPSSEPLPTYTATDQRCIIIRGTEQ